MKSPDQKLALLWLALMPTSPLWADLAPLKGPVQEALWVRETAWHMLGISLTVSLCSLFFLWKLEKQRVTGGENKNTVLPFLVFLFLVGMITISGLMTVGSFLLLFQ